MDNPVNAEPLFTITAYESAVMDVERLTQMIADLTKKREWAKRRVVKYRGSTILESERRATAAEPFQKHQLSQP